MMILEVTKNQSLTLFLENTISEEPQGRAQIGPPPALFGLKEFFKKSVFTLQL